MGVEVVPFDLPEVAIEAIDFIRYAETAAAFDDPTRNGTLRAIETRSRSRAPARPRFVPAGSFPPWSTSRRTGIACASWNKWMPRCPDSISSSERTCLLTNRTGHPVISVPSGFFEGSPTGLQLTGKLFGEPELLLLAHAFQSRTDHHSKHPSLL